MKTATALLLLFLSGLAAASDYRPLETIDQARQRRSAENYDAYRSRGGDAPLGGYQDRLGDPAPRGTERPGYAPSQPTWTPPDRQRNDDWRDRLRR